MKYFAFFGLAFILFSCREPETPKTETPSYQASQIPDDTIKTLSKLTDTTTLVLMGRGSEPGWLCEFYPNRVRFVYDHGKDSIILRGLNFSYQMGQPKGFELFKLQSPCKDTIFETLPGPCTEETTGETRSMKMQITIGKNTYKGCAWTPK